MVLTVLAQIRAPVDARPDHQPIPVLPSKCATDAPLVLRLWRADGKRDPAEFAHDVVSVARAARWCPHPMFAREIRAEGWQGGTNRMRLVANICRQRPPEDSAGASWSERLDEARTWEAAGCPLTMGQAPSGWQGPGPPARASPLPRSGPRPTVLDTFDALADFARGDP